MAQASINFPPASSIDKSQQEFNTGPLGEKQECYLDAQILSCNYLSGFERVPARLYF